jgi:uncharacterized protein (DUF1330 family)
MPAFCLFQNLNITDPSKMEQYVENVPPITKSFGGEYVVMGGESQVKEGTWSPTMPVLIQFPTLEAANAWYNSEEYAPLKKLRESAGEFSAVFIKGI